MSRCLLSLSLYVSLYPSLSLYISIHLSLSLSPSHTPRGGDGERVGVHVEGALNPTSSLLSLSRPLSLSLSRSLSLQVPSTLHPLLSLSLSPTHTHTDREVATARELRLTSRCTGCPSFSEIATCNASGQRAGLSREPQTRSRPRTTAYFCQAIHHSGVRSGSGSSQGSGFRISDEGIG